jgi:hypothetical protein
LYEVVFHIPNRSSYDATGEECEQTVELSVAGRELSPLHDSSCAVLDLVAANLPGRAVATKQAAAGCGAST